jgi:hypothetical protein
MSSRSSSPGDILAGAPGLPTLPVLLVIIAAQLTYYTTIPAQGKKKPKQKKESKTKELKHSFTATSENYVKFLQAILTKHGEEKYNITIKKRFSFKAICPPNKAYVLVPLVDSWIANSLAVAKQTLWISTMSRSSNSLSPTSLPTRQKRSSSSLTWLISTIRGKR